MMEASSGRLRVALLPLILLFVCPLANAQSMADAAQKEKDRRKALAGSAHVYTEDDLSTAKKERSSDTVPAGPGPVASPSPKALSAPSGDQAEEALWRGRQAAAEARVAEAEARLAANKALLNPYTEVHNPRLLEAISAAEQDLASAKKALADLEEAGRKAGVPPGWLRN